MEKQKISKILNVDFLVIFQNFMMSVIKNKIQREFKVNWILSFSTKYLLGIIKAQIKLRL